MTCTSTDAPAMGCAPEKAARVRLTAWPRTATFGKGTSATTVGEFMMAAMATAISSGLPGGAVNSSTHVPGVGLGMLMTMWCPGVENGSRSGPAVPLVTERRSTDPPMDSMLASVRRTPVGVVMATPTLPTPISASKTTALASDTTMVLVATGAPGASRMTSKVVAVRFTPVPWAAESPGTTRTVARTRNACPTHARATLRIIVVS